MNISAPGRLARFGLPLAFALCAALPVVSAADSPRASASAKAAHGVRPTAPKNGAVIARNTFPRFKALVRGSGVVYIRICKKRKRASDGQLCKRGGDDLVDIDRPKKGRKKGRARVRYFDPDRYTFPTYYLQSPGTYYWQMYRIKCVQQRRNRLDCIQESPTQKFTVQ